MIITLYHIKELQDNQPISITFSSELERLSFFNGITYQETINQTLSPGWLENIWKLNNEITIFDEGRRPFIEYNYVRIKEFINSKEYYFYIVDYDELGNNQINFKLKKDTLMTYVTTPNEGIDITSNKSLVLREHKNRFDFLERKPIYHESIEDINITPSVVTLETEFTGSRETMVLRKYGGGLEGTNILSQPIYAWDVYGGGNKSLSQSEFILPLGWGIETPDPHLGSYQLIWISDTDEGALITIEGAERAWRFVFDSVNKRFIIEKTVGESFDNANTTIDGGAAFMGGNIYLHGNGVLYLVYTLNMGQMFLRIHMNQGMEFEGPTPTYNRTNVFVIIDSNNYIARNKQTVALNKAESTNQKIIQLPYHGEGNYLGMGANPGTRILANSRLTFNPINVDLVIPFAFNYSFNDVDKVNIDPKVFTSQFNPFFLNWYNESIPLRVESRIEDDSIEFQIRTNESDYSKALITPINNNYRQKVPYEITKIVDMNNTVAAVKDDFANYIDTLAEGDKRLLELQQSKSSRDMIQQSVNAATNIGVGLVGGLVASGGNPVGALVGAGVGAVKAVTNIGFAIANNNQAKEERQIQYNQKIKGLQQSLINITGTDVELANAINSDYVKLYSIKPKDYEIEYLDNYFHLFGYQTLEYKPIQLRSRLYWDYKQVILNEVETFAPITEEVKNDIRERFAMGTTFFHARNSASIPLTGTINGDSGDFGTYDVNAPGISYLFSNLDKLINVSSSDVSIIYWEVIGDEIHIEAAEYQGIIKLISGGTWESNFNGVSTFGISFVLESAPPEIDFKQRKENWENE